MAPRKPKAVPSAADVVQKESALVPVTNIEKSVVLEGDPEAQLAFAQKASKALMSVVSSKPKKVMINGKQYLEFGDWQTLGRFFGATVATDWTKPLIRDDGTTRYGYEARAVVYHKGEVISAAEAMCTVDEKRWGDADEFAIRSMAQTRASAKALRTAYGWVAELAGYASTPAEEMDRFVESMPPRDMPVAPVKPQISVKAKIVFLLKELGHNPASMTPEEIDENVRFYTNLPLEEVNYPAIVRALEDCVKAQAKFAPPGEMEIPE